MEMSEGDCILSYSQFGEDEEQSMQADWEQKKLT